jgi:hypothetical protein
MMTFNCRRPQQFELLPRHVNKLSIVQRDDVDDDDDMMQTQSDGWLACGPK